MNYNLTRTDMPILLGEEDEYKLSWGPRIVCPSNGIKYASDLEDLFQNPGYLPAGEPCYRFYRSIVERDKQEVFEGTGYHYDLTVILPSPKEGECKKTSGHFHSLIAEGTSSYAEIYEVILGRALYVLMKVNDSALPAEQQVIEDAYLVEVHEGERIILPPLYGHGSINIGDGPLVFSNIACSSNKSDYRPVRYRHGLCYYASHKDGALRVEINPNYSNVPQPRILRPRESEALGITFGRSLYRQFLEQPSRYFYVGNPVGFEAEIMRQQGAQ